MLTRVLIRLLALQAFVVILATAMVPTGIPTQTPTYVDGILSTLLLVYVIFLIQK